jgi:hypothetical protein
MHRTVGSLTLVALAVVSACSAKDAPKKDSAAVAQAGAAAAPKSRGTFDLATHTATIHTKDFAFEAPDTISGGLTTFRLMNDGPALHHVQLVRLDSGKTVADLQAALKNPGPPPRWALFVGGPNAPDPSGEMDATFDVAPGNYAIICLVDIGDHIPHFAKGMMKGLVVTPAAGTPMAMPTADVTIALADYNFVIKGALTPGKHTIKVENNGPQPHELEMIRLAPGKTVKDLMAWIDKAAGPPPANAIGGVVALMPSLSGFATVDLAPGNYLLVCFIPDSKDGKPHAEHGMLKEIKIG